MGKAATASKQSNLDALATAKPLGVDGGDIAQQLEQ